MVDPELYRLCRPGRPQCAAPGMLDGPGFYPAVQAMIDDFRPAFFAELDWQGLRIDRDYSTDTRVYEIVHDYVFAATLPANLVWRSGGQSPANRPELVPRFGGFLNFFDRWQAAWPDREACSALPPESDRAGEFPCPLPSRPSTSY